MSVEVPPDPRNPNSRRETWNSANTLLFTAPRYVATTRSFGSVRSRSVLGSIEKLNDGDDWLVVFRR